STITTGAVADNRSTRVSSRSAIAATGLSGPPNPGTNWSDESSPASTPSPSNSTRSGTRCNATSARHQNTWQPVTSAPARPALTSADLPIPGSPSTSADPPRPAATPSTNPRRRSSSVPRPTNPVPTRASTGSLPPASSSRYPNLPPTPRPHTQVPEPVDDPFTTWRSGRVRRGMGGGLPRDLAPGPCLDLCQDVRHV